MLSIIAAMANNRVIGLNNEMPWHLPRELQHFKQTTVAKPIIMGRTTFDSLGGALPSRHNLVVSRQQHLTLPNAEICHNIDQAITLTQQEEEVMIIGGASIYQQTINRVDRMYLTFIDLTVTGDTFFPEWNETQWRRISENHHPIADNNPHAFTCVCLDRR